MVAAECHPTHVKNLSMSLEHVKRSLNSYATDYRGIRPGGDSPRKAGFYAGLGLFCATPS